MPQPRIDMRVIRRGVIAASDTAAHFSLDIGSAIAEDLQALVDELNDHADGAKILIALTPQEAEVIVERLKRAQGGYLREDGHPTMTLSQVSAIDSALEEVSSALRGVVVQK